MIDDVLVDGVSVGAVDSYTFSNIDANHTIAASFKVSAHVITASAGANGSIDPSGVVIVSDGVDQSFTITPDTGYQVDDVLVDGVSVGAVGTYTFTDVTANHTIAASFKKITFTITASAGAGGSISPSGAVSVDYGTDKTFTITPNDGFAVAGVLVDGGSVGAVAPTRSASVTANHTIAASFKLAAKPVGAINRSVLTDPLLPGRVVKAWGRVVSIDGTLSFAMTDGYSSNVTVKINGVALPSGFGTGRTAIVTGLVNADRTIKAYIIEVY